MPGCYSENKAFLFLSGFGTEYQRLPTKAASRTLAIICTPTSLGSTSAKLDQGSYSLSSPSGSSTRQKSALQRWNVSKTVCEEIRRRVGGLQLIWRDNNGDQTFSPCSYVRLLSIASDISRHFVILVGRKLFWILLFAFFLRLNVLQRRMCLPSYWIS